MNRKELLESPGYWIAKLQLQLYNCAEEFMAKNGLNRTGLAKHLGVSKGYVTQLLSGEYNFSVTKMIELCLAMGFVPEVSFKPVDEIVLRDSISFQTSSVIWAPCEYSRAMIYKSSTDLDLNEFNNEKQTKSELKCA